MTENYIRFDWAMKRLLRDKTNHVVLEGFLSTLLDEWVRFLKTGQIESTDTAKGLPEAREKLRIDALNTEEKQAYYRDMEAIRYQRSVINTGWYEGKAEGLPEGKAEGLAEGKAEGLAEGEKLKQLEIARKMNSKGFSINDICDMTGLTLEDMEKL